MSWARSGRRLAERDAGLAQDGRERRAGRSRRHAQGSQGQAAGRPGRGGREGLSLAAAQEEAKRCLQCVCPSLGSCDLQRLGVEYGITANELVKKGSRVRVVEPQYEHPFITARHGALHHPAAAACGSAATWPARPATTSPDAASP